MKLTDEVLEVIDTAMQDDDRSTARELCARLQQLYMCQNYVTLYFPERVRIYLAGLFIDLPTVKLYMLRTQRSDWSGPKELVQWF